MLVFVLDKVCSVSETQTLLKSLWGDFNTKLKWLLKFWKLEDQLKIKAHVEMNNVGKKNKMSSAVS